MLVLYPGDMEGNSQKGNVHITKEHRNIHLFSIIKKYIQIKIYHNFYQIGNFFNDDVEIGQCGRKKGHTNSVLIEIYLQFGYIHQKF